MKYLALSMLIGATSAFGQEIESRIVDTGRLVVMTKTVKVDFDDLIRKIKSTPLIEHQNYIYFVKKVDSVRIQEFDTVRKALTTSCGDVWFQNNMSAQASDKDGFLVSFMITGEQNKPQMVKCIQELKDRGERVTLSKKVLEYNKF